jgi:hypothetical protein
MRTRYSGDQIPPKKRGHPLVLKAGASCVTHMMGRTNKKKTGKTITKRQAQYHMAGAR